VYSGYGDIGTLFKVNNRKNHIRWVPCHHIMVHPQIADGGKSSRYRG